MARSPAGSRPVREDHNESSSSKAGAEENGALCHGWGMRAACARPRCVTLAGQGGALKLRAEMLGEQEKGLAPTTGPTTGI
eukprot:243841-Chlamydomonas_euryale.AAC.3